MNRRRIMLMNGQEENEVKEWVELLNERERTVTDLQNVEFDLATNESHSEYWMRFEIGQHTGENTVNGKPCRQAEYSIPSSIQVKIL